MFTALQTLRQRRAVTYNNAFTATERAGARLRALLGNSHRRSAHVRALCVFNQLRAAERAAYEAYVAI